MWGNISQLVKNSLNQDSDGESNPSTPERTSTRDHRRDNNSMLEGLQNQLTEAEDRNKSINEEFKKILKNKEREIKLLRSENESLSMSRTSNTSLDVTDSAVEITENNTNNTLLIANEDISQLQRKLEEYEILISQKDSTLQIALAQMKEAEDLKDKVEEQERKNTEKLMHELAGRIKAHETVQRKMEEMKHVIEEKDNAVRNMADQLGAQDDLLRSRQDAIKKLKRINAGSEATEDMIATLQSEILRKDKALSDLQEQLDKAVTGQKLLESSVSNRDELGSSKDKTIETLWAEIHQKDELINKLSTSKDTRFEDLEQKSQQLKTKMTQLQNENDQLASTIDTLERKLEQSNNKLLKSSTELEDQLKSLEDELKVKNEMLTSKEQAISMIHKDLDEKVSENQHVTRELSSLKFNLETAEAERDEISRKCSKEQEDKVELGSRWEMVVEERDNLIKRLENVQQQLAENRANNEQNLNDTQNLIESEQQEKQDLLNKHNQLNDANKNLEKELQQQHADLSSKDEIIIENNKQLSELKEMIQSLNDENLYLKNHVDEMTNEKDSLISELDTSSSGQSSLKSSNLELNEKLSATEQELSSVNSKCTELVILNQKLEAASAVNISEKENILQKQTEMEQALEEFVRATEMRKRKSGRSSAEGPSRVDTPSDEQTPNSFALGSPSKSLLVNIGDLLASSEANPKSAIGSKTFGDVFRVLEEERCTMEDKLDAVIQERNELMQQASQLDNQVEAEKERSNHLNVQLDNDQLMIEKMNLSADHYEEQLRIINEAMAQGEKALSEVTAEKAKLEEHITSLQATMEDKINNLLNINKESVVLRDQLNLQIEVLQTQNNELSEHLAAIKIEIQEKCKENKSLQNSIATLEENMLICNHSLSDQKQINDTFQQQVNDLESQNEEHIQRCKEVALIKEDLESTVDSLGKEVKDKDDMLSDSNAKLQQTLSLLEQIESRNASMNERISSLDNEVSSYQAKLKHIIETVDLKEVENQELCNKLTSMTDQLSIVIDDKDTFKTKVDELTDELVSKEQLCSDFESKLELVGKEAEEKEERSKKLLEEYESLIADKDQSTGNIMETNRLEIEEMSDEVHKLRLELQEAVSKSEADARIWNDDRSKMDEAMQDTNKKHLDCIDNLSVSQDNLFTVETKYKELQDAKENMETELHEKIYEMEASCNRSRDQCDSLLVEVNELRQSMELKVAELDDTKERLVEAEKSNEAVIKELQEVTDTLEKCKESLIAKESLINEYTERCEQAGIELSTVTEHKKLTEQNLQETVELLFESKQRINMLEDREKQLMTDDSLLKGELEQTLTTFDEVSCQARNSECLVEDLKKQLQNAANEIQSLVTERDECIEISHRRLEELHESAKEIEEERCRNEESGVAIGDLRHQLKCYEEKVSLNASESGSIISAKLETIERLETELKSRQCDIESMQKEAIAINKEFQDCKVLLDNLNIENSQLKDLLHSSENENMQKATESQLQVMQLEKSVAEKLSTISQLEHTMEDLQHALIAKDEKLFTEIQEKEEIIDTLNKLKAELTTTVSQLNNKIEALDGSRERIVQLEACLSDGEKRAGDLQGETSILEESIREDQEQISHLKTELIDCEALLKESQSEVIAIHKEIEKLNAEIVIEKTMNESSKEAIAKLTEGLQQKENRMIEKETEILQLQKNIKDLQISIDNQKVELSEVQCKSQANMTKTNEEMTQSENLVAKLQSEAELLRSEKDELSSKYQQLQIKLDKKIKIFEELKAKATLKVKTLKEELKSMLNELETTKEKLCDSQEQNAIAEKMNSDKISELQESLSLATSERDHLANESEAQAERLSSLLNANDALQTLEVCNKDLRANNSELSDANGVLVNDLQKVRGENDVLLKQSQELQKQCDEAETLTDELESLRATISTLEKEQEDSVYCIESQKEQIKGLIQDAEMKEDNIKAIESDKNKLVTKVKDQIEEGNTVREMLKEALDQVQSSQHEIASRDVAIEELRERQVDQSIVQEKEIEIENLQLQIKKSQDAVLALQESFDVEALTRSTLNSDYEVLRAKVIELEAALGNDRNRISELQTEINTLSESKHELEIFLQDSDVLNKSLLDENEKKRMELSNMQESISNLQNNKDEIQQIFTSNQSLLLEKQSLMLELDDSRQLVEQLNDMKERLRSTMEDKSMLEEKTMATESLLTDSDTLIKALQREVEELKAEMLNHINASANESEKEQQQLKLKCAKLIKKCQGFKKSNEVNEKSINDLKENLGKACQNLSYAENEMTSLKQSSNLANEQIEKLKNSICEKDNDIETMEQELVAANSKILDLTHSLDQSLQEQHVITENKGEQMQSLQAMVNQLEIELKSCKKAAFITETPFECADGQILVATAPTTANAPVEELMVSSEVEAVSMTTPDVGSNSTDSLIEVESLLKEKESALSDLNSSYTKVSSNFDKARKRLAMMKKVELKLGKENDMLQKELELYKSKIAEVSTEHEAAKNETDDLKSAKLHLEMRIEELIQLFNKVDAEKNTLKTDFEVISSEIESLKSLKFNADEELEKANASLLSTESRCQHLSEEVQRLNDLTTQQSEHFQKLKDGIFAEESKIAAKESAMVDMLESMQGLKEEAVAEMKEQLDQSTNENQHLKNIVAEQGKANEKIRGEMEQISAAKQKTEEDLQNLNVSIKDLQNERDNLKTEADSSLSRIDALEWDLDVSRDKSRTESISVEDVHSIRNQLVTIESERNYLLEELEQTKMEVVKSKDESGGQIHDLQNLLNIDKEKLSKLEKENLSLAEQLENVKIQYQEKFNDLTLELEKSHDDLMNQNQSIEQDCKVQNEKDELVEKLQSELLTKQISLQQEETDIKALKQEITDMKSHKDDIIRKLKIKVKQVMKDRDLIRENLQTEIERLTQERDLIFNEVQANSQDKEAALRNTEIQLIHIQNELDDSKAALEERDQEINELRAALDGSDDDSNEREQLLEAKLEEKCTELDKYRWDASDTEAKLHDLEQRLGAITADKEEIDELLRLANEAVEVKDDIIAKLRGQLSVSGVDLISENKSNDIGDGSHQQKIVDDLRTVVDLLTASNQSINSELNEKTEFIDALCYEFEEDFDSSLAQKIIDQHQSLQHEIATFKQQLERKKSIESNREPIIDLTNCDPADLVQRLQESETECQQLESTVEDMEATVKELEATVEYQEVNTRKLETSIEELGSTVEYQTSTVKDLMEAIEGHKDGFAVIERELEEKQTNLQELKAELQSRDEVNHEINATSEMYCQTEDIDLSLTLCQTISRGTNTEVETDQLLASVTFTETEADQSGLDTSNNEMMADDLMSNDVSAVIEDDQSTSNIANLEGEAGQSQPLMKNDEIASMSKQFEKATSKLIEEAKQYHILEQQFNNISIKCQNLELAKTKAETETERAKALLTRLQADFDSASRHSSVVEDKLQNSCNDDILPQISERIAEKNKTLKELRENFEIVVIEKDNIIEQLRNKLTKANDDYRKEAEDSVSKANELNAALDHAQLLNTSFSNRTKDLEGKLAMTQKRFERVLEENKLIGTSLIDEFEDISQGLRQDVHLAIKEKKDLASTLEVDRLTLENQIANLQEKLHNTEFKFSHLKTTLSEKDMLISELQDRVEAASGLLSRQKYYESLESRTRAVESDLQTSLIEQEGLNNALNGMRVAKEQLEHDYAALSHQQHKLTRNHTTECDQVRLEKAEYCQQLRSSFDSIVSEKDTVLNELRDRMQSLQKEDDTMIAKHDADIDSLKNEYAYQIEELQNRMSDLISEKEIILKEKSNQAGLNENFEQLLKEKNDVLSDKTNEITRLHDDITNKDIELTNISKQISSLHNDIQLKNSKIDELSSENMSLMANSASAIEQALIDKTNTVTELREGFDKILANEKEEHSGLEAKSATLQANYMKLHNTIESMKKEKAIADQSLSDANLSMELLSAEIKTIANEKQLSVSEIEKLAAALGDSQKTCCDLKRNINDLKSHYDALASNIHREIGFSDDTQNPDLDSTVSNVLVHLNRLKQELEDALSLQLELDIGNAKIHELEQRNHSLDAERLSLEKDVISANIAKDNAIGIAREDLEYTLKNLRGDLERATSDNDRLQSEMFFMRKDTVAMQPNQSINVSTNTPVTVKEQTQHDSTQATKKSINEIKPQIIEECIQQSPAAVTELLPDPLLSPIGIENNNESIYDMNQLHEELGKQKKLASKFKSMARRYKQQVDETTTKSREEIDSLIDVCQRLRQDVSDWREQCNMKELNLKTMREEVDSLVQEKVGLVERYRNESQVAAVENNNKIENISQTFNKQIEELRHKLDYLNSQTADLENNLSFKESELSAVSGTNTTQELHINDLQHKLSVSNASCFETREQFENEYQKRVNVEERLHHASSELDELHHYLAEKTTVDVGTDNAAFDIVDLSSRDEQMQDLINRFTTSEEKVNVAQRLLQASSERLSMLENEKMDRERTMHDLRKEIGELFESKNQTIEIWNEKLHAAEASKETEIKTLAESHDEQRTAYLDEMDVMQNKLNDAMNELLNSKSSIANLTSEVDELRSHLDASNNRCNAMQLQYQAVVVHQEQSNSSYQDFEHRATDQLREKDHAIFSLKETVDRLSIEHAERQQNIDSLQKSRLNDNTAINEIKASLVREQQRCKRLESDLLYATGRNHALEADTQLATQNALSHVEESNQQLRLSAYKKDKQLQEDRVIIDQLMQEKEILSGQIRRLAAKTSATTDQSDGLIVPPKDETLQLEIAQLRLQIQSLAAEKDAVNEHHDHVVEEMIGELSSERQRSEALNASQRLLQAKLFSVLKGFQSLLSDLKNSQADLKDDLLTKLDTAKQDLNFMWFEIKSKLPGMKSQNELESPQVDGMARLGFLGPPRSPDSVVSSSTEARLYENEQQLLDATQNIVELQNALRSWKDRCVDLEDQLQHYNARSPHNRSNDLLINIDDDDDSPTIASARTGFGANVKRLVAYGASGIKSRTRSWTPLRVYSGGRSIASTLSVIPAKKFLLILYMLTLHAMALIALKCLL